MVGSLESPNFVQIKDESHVSITPNSLHSDEQCQWVPESDYLVDGRVYDDYRQSPFVIPPKHILSA